MRTGRNTNSAAASMPSSGHHPISCAGSTACRWWSSPKPRNQRGTPGCGRPSTKPVRMPVPPRTFTERCIGKGIFSAVTLYGGRRMHSVLIPSAEAESCQQGKRPDKRQDSRDHVCPFPQRKAARATAHDCRFQGRALFPQGIFLRTDGKHHPETFGELLPQAAGLRAMRWRYNTRRNAKCMSV